MAMKFKYINEIDRKTIQSAKKTLRKLKNKFLKFSKAVDDESVDLVEIHKRRDALWRFCDELDYCGIMADCSEDCSTGELSLGV